MTTTDFVLDYFDQHASLPGGSLEEQLAVNYIDTGIVDSMGIVRFVVACEEHFGVRFEAEHLQSDEFLTVGGLIAILNRLLAARQETA